VKPILFESEITPWLFLIMLEVIGSIENCDSLSIHRRSEDGVLSMKPLDMAMTSWSLEEKRPPIKE
jgi:hypothetical protein